MSPIATSVGPFAMASQWVVVMVCTAIAALVGHLIGEKADAIHAIVGKSGRYGIARRLSPRGGPAQSPQPGRVELTEQSGGFKRRHGGTLWESRLR